MGSRTRKVSLAIFAVMLAFVGYVSGSTTPASAESMAQLNATQIVAQMGAGWNLGNALEANANGIPSETAWGNPTVTQAFVDRVKAAGFRSIRIPVSYLGLIGPGPDYTINSSWLNRIQEVVNYAYGRGLYVMINMHGDGYKTVQGSWLICDSSAQATIKAKYQRAWQQIATKFQDYDEHLIFESMNENFDGQYGSPTQPCYSNLNSYNQIFVDTTRRTGGNNSSRWLLIPGWNTNIDYTVGNYGFALPTDQYRSPSVPSNEQRIMISVHYYDPWDFTGTENGTITQWGSGATNPSKTAPWAGEDYLDGQLKKVRDAFIARGYPVVVGEYGSIDKTAFDSASNRYRADFARAVVATSKKYGAATVYWDNGYNGQYGHGLFNRGSATVTQQGIITAIMSAIGTPPTTTPPPTTPPPTTPPPTTPPPTTPPPTTPPPTGRTCTAGYTVVNQWPAGFQAEVRVTAGGSAVSGWTVTWNFANGERVAQSWSATVSSSGSTVSARNVNHNGSIGAGASITFGFLGSVNGTTRAPSLSCVAN